MVLLFRHFMVTLLWGLYDIILTLYDDIIWILYNDRYDDRMMVIFGHMDWYGAII